MKIVNLNIENIKKIKVVDITPGKDGAVIIEGKNAQGKSSIMDAISMAVGGEKLIPADPVRQGQERAMIKLDLGDVVVKRTFKQDGSSALEIKTSAGEKVRSPQEWLNERLKVATLDPVAFMRMRPVERVEELKKIPGLDCTEFEQKHTVLYDKRKLVNRDLETAKKALISEYGGLIAPKEQRTVAQIQKEIDAIEDKNKLIREANKVINDQQAEFDRLKVEHEHITKEKDSVRASWDTALSDIKEAEEIIRAQQERIAKLNKATENYKEKMIQLEKSASAIKDAGMKVKKEIELSMLVPELDTSKLKGELVAASEVTAVNEKLARKAELESKIRTYEKDVEGIESEMMRNQEAKKAKLAAFKLPIDGLEVGEKDIMFSGITFGNISTAQQLKVSAALAMAQNPTLRIMLVKEGSLLDADSLNWLIDYVIKNDMQLMLERVANTPSGNAIFIEDGEVVKQ